MFIHFIHIQEYCPFLSFHFRDMSNNQFQNIPDNLFEHLVSLRRV